MSKIPVFVGSWQKFVLVSVLIVFFAASYYAKLVLHISGVNLLLPSVLLVSLTTFFIGNRNGFLFLCVTLLVWFSTNMHTSSSNTSMITSEQIVKPLFIIMHYFLILYVKKIFIIKEKLALVDDLTGISNRRGFLLLAQHELRRLQRKDEAISVAFIDVDNFKQMNDTMGHKEGDKILKELSTVLKTSTRGSDVCGRIGGDEFVVLFSNVNSTSVHDIASRMNERFKERCENNKWTTSLSIGILTTKKEVELDELIKRSDSLMYKAKKTGKNKIEFDNL